MVPRSSSLRVDVLGACPWYVAAATPASRSFVLASLRALHLDPSHAGGGFRPEEEEPADVNLPPRSGCARVCCHDPRSRRGRPLDCVHLIGCRTTPCPTRRGAEMTDTPGTPGEVVVLDTTGDGTTRQATQPRSTPIERHTDPARPNARTRLQRDPLDKSCSFRDDTRGRPVANGVSGGRDDAGL